MNVPRVLRLRSVTIDDNNTAATWRDLAQHLTPEQIAELERLERRRDTGDTRPFLPRELPDALLFFARHYAAENSTGA